MSLEDALNANTAALEALTKAMSAAGKAAASAGSTSGGSTKTSAEYKAKHSKEETLAIMNKVKEDIGADKAKEIRDTVGKVAKLSMLEDPKVIDAVYDAADAALKAHADADV